jgi:beta-phosphoglucomutase-like phosphatase (HAD superfamily)
VKLVQDGRIPSIAVEYIQAVKQAWTLREAANLCFPQIEHLILLGVLKAYGLKIGVATNSVRESALVMLSYSGILDQVDHVLTNEDVVQAKPSPEIYKKITELLGVTPSECLVIEDHDIGRTAALSAGCHVIKVKGPSEVDSDLILQEIERINGDG